MKYCSVVGLQPLPKSSLLKDRHCWIILTTLQELCSTGNTSVTLLGDYVRLLLIHLYSGKVRIKAFGFSETNNFSVTISNTCPGVGILTFQDKWIQYFTFQSSAYCSLPPPFNLADPVRTERAPPKLCAVFARVGAGHAHPELSFTRNIMHIALWLDERLFSF